MLSIYCGIDWSEQHHDIALVDENGLVVVRNRIAESVAGFGVLTALLREHAGTDALAVPIAIETDRGLLVAALRASGYRVYVINPKAVDRYRDRYRSSRAKSDARDAQLLADIVRTDAVHHRVLGQESSISQSVAVLARAHQDAVWTQSREVNRLRSVLREFFPAALTAFPDLRTRSALGPG